MNARPVELHGFERWLTMVPGISMKIANVMHVRGDVALLRERIHDAMLFTANKHPRLRGKQSRKSFATAELLPPLKIADVRDLVRFTTFQTSNEWQAFVQTECDVPFDRYTQLPFFVVVATELDATDQANLILFTDHYLSDGKSGMVVLNDIVSQVAHPSSEPPTEEPLYESVYELWFAGSKWKRWLSECAMRWIGTLAFKSHVFKPVLPLRADQSDFTIPPTVNSSRAMFCVGTSASQKAALQKCREERVTFFGAMLAAAAVSYYNAVRATKAADEDISDDGRFHLLMEVDFNMRQRLSTLDDNTVGMYVMMATLESLAQKGICLKTTTFWDLARRAKQQTEALLTTQQVGIPAAFLDQKMHERTTQQELGLVIPQSVLSDVNLSNVGRYPFATEHQVVHPTSKSTLSIDNLWVYNNVPTLSAGGVFFVTSVKCFNFAFCHKYESELARSLFSTFVDCIESLATLSADATLEDVAYTMRTKVIRP